MNLPANLFSTAFRQQRLGLMLSVLIGIMVYLGSLAMAAQAVLARTSFVWGQDIQNRLTIEVPYQTEQKAADRAQKIIDALKGNGGVKSVALLPETETARLLRPWVEDEDLLKSLSLPRLIDVEFAPGGGMDAEGLRALLKSHFGDLRVHRHEQGMNEILGFLRALGALAGVMLALTGLALVAIIWIICRAAMAVQHETIELLHYMGATDSIVALHFQRHVRRLAFASALTGFLFAVASVVALAFMIGSMGGISLVSPVSWMTAIGVMALVPLGAVLLSIATARLSVHRLLRRLL